MSKPTFAERCLLAEQCLPDAPYRAMLKKLHAEMREALAEQPAQQEPVATVVSESGNPNVSMSWWHEPALPVGTKLYTSPPAQRTWVGLTDEEVKHQWEIWRASIPRYAGFARAIEAKLREKNAQPIKPWTDLTKEDKREIIEATERDDRGYVMALTEAKLKDRNT